MPTYRIKSPSGKTYNVTAPEGATKEDVLARIQAQEGAASPSPAPAPEAAPAAPDASSGGAPTAAGGGPSPAAPPAPDPSAPYDPNVPGSRYNPVNDMSVPEKLAAGFGQSFVSTGRGIQQLYNYITGDDKKLKELMDEEADARKYDANLLDTASGRVGQIAGIASQFAIPAGAFTKAAKLAQLGLAGTMATEAAVGGGTAALTPTAEEGERGQNVILGSALGGAIPLVAKVGGSVGGMKSALIRLLTGTAESGTGNKIGQKMAGSMIGSSVKDAKVSLDAKKLQSVLDTYGDSFPKEIRTSLQDQVNLAQSGAKFKGQAAQDMYSILSQTANESSPMAATGMNQAKRSIDQSLKDALSSAKVRQLNLARRAYNTGQSPYATLQSGAWRTPTAYEFLKQPEPPEDQ